jgi:methyl-accepting chemotaxis protein
MSAAGHQQLEVTHRTYDRLGKFFVGSLLVAIAVVSYSVSRSISQSVARLHAGAETVVAGDLDHEVDVVTHDEIGKLSRAFNVMTARLRQSRELLENEVAERRHAEASIQQAASELKKTAATERAARAHIEKLVGNIREALQTLSTSSQQILSTTTNQLHGAVQQAETVSQTTATVSTVAQTAREASERAEAVAQAARRADEVSHAGRCAVVATMAAMDAVRDPVEHTAESIVALAERAQTIGEIISSVNDIADRTNLLALNAAIEASRAGEHGKGFSVVAAEVKALADESKKSTAQIRQILSEIQQATHTAVVSTEQGTKSVSEATNVVKQAEETINVLSDTISEAARAAAQIVGAAPH